MTLIYTSRSRGTQRMRSWTQPFSDVEGPFVVCGGGMYGTRRRRISVLIEWHAERYFKRPPTELVRQRARTAGYQCTSKGRISV